MPRERTIALAHGREVESRAPDLVAGGAPHPPSPLHRGHAITHDHQHAAVSVPGSTSNLGAGFDCIGVAIDRWLHVSARATGDDAFPSPRITRHGTLAALREPPERDALWVGFHAACAERGAAPPAGMVFSARSSIPVGRGLGSSAAALVAGAALADAMLHLELGAMGLAELCTRLEGHPDNATPAVFGGAVLAVARDGCPLAIAPLDVHPALALVFAIPDFAVDTSAARAALPASLPHGTAVRAAARAAALVRGLATGDDALLAAALDDVLHVPYRRALIPGYDAVTRAAIEAGAFGATLSGAGSGLVAIAPAPATEGVGDAMRRAWDAHGVAAETFAHTRPVRGYEMREE